MSMNDANISSITRWIPYASVNVRAISNEIHVIFSFSSYVS